MKGFFAQNECKYVLRSIIKIMKLFERLGFCILIVNVQSISHSLIVVINFILYNTKAIAIATKEFGEPTKLIYIKCIRTYLDENILINHRTNIR